MEMSTVKLMQSTNNHLNILTVEDNPGDLFLVENMLRSTHLRIDHLYSADRVIDANGITATPGLIAGNSYSKGPPIP